LKAKEQEKARVTEDVAETLRLVTDEIEKNAQDYDVFTDAQEIGDDSSRSILP